MPPVVENHFTYLTSNYRPRYFAWFLDSGATTHMSGNRRVFRNLKRFGDDGLRTVTQASGTKILATGVGEVILRLPSPKNDGCINVVTLSEVWYVPELSVNLLSIHDLNSKGLTVNFAKDFSCTISNDNEAIAYTRAEGQLRRLVMENDSNAEVYIARAKTGKINPLRYTQANQETLNRTMSVPTIASSEATDSSKRRKANDSTVVTVSVKPASLETWHRRLGHLNYQSIKQLTNLADGLSISKQPPTSDNTATLCRPCILGKHHIL
jgi:hypothetical protein